MMNKIFQEEIGEALKVYMDDMIEKSSRDELRNQHLQQVFKRIMEYNLRLNHTKCTFGVRDDKFLGFYLNERGIEANPR